MKKTFIILGIILLIIIGAVWAYLFMYGVPKSADEVFARFQSDPGTPVFVGNESDSVVDVAPVTPEGALQRLRQLTTRPVAGAIALDGLMRYTERGTGHVYDINLRTGEERMVSGTTIPKTIRAVFSPSGDQIALTYIVAEEEEVMVGTLKASGGEGSLDGNTLPLGAREVAFTDASSTVSYYLPSEGGGSAHAYNVLTQKSLELFTTPLTDVRIIWGKDTYVYTTPSAVQIGYVYHIEGGTLGYLTQGGKGLSALAYTGGVIVTRSTEKGLSSTDITHGVEIPVIGLIPEKCTTSIRERGVLYCGAQTSFDSTKKYPDDWYKGVVSFSDTLFRIDAPSSTVQILSALEGESGRSIDIAQIGIDKNSEYLYFINKNDNTLWMFDMSTQ
jgi:hypothetical protein